MKVLLVGARGAIGQVLRREFKGIDAEVVCVYRQGSTDELDFGSLFEIFSPDEFDLIVDAASLSLEDALRMVTWVGRGDTPVFHFSSVRVAAGDAYGEYKRQVASLYQKRISRVCVLNGDLFRSDSDLVGYWSFVTDCFNWRYISFRSLRVLDLGELAPFCESYLASGEAQFDSDKLADQMDYLDSYCLPQVVVKLLMKLRINLVARFFRVSVVL